MAGLFEVSRPTRTQDSLIAKKSKSTKKAPVSVKGGSSLIDRINQIVALVQKNLGQFEDETILINTIDGLREYLETSARNNVIAIDTETTGLDPLLDNIVGLCLYTPGEKTAYVPINHISYITNMRSDGQLTEEEVGKELTEFFNHHSDIESVMFNANFDIRFIRNQLKTPNVFCTWDCSLASRLLNENEPNKRLKPLHNKYCLEGKGDAFTFDDLFNGISFNLIPIKTASLYAGHDPKITYELCAYQKQYLSEDSDREDMRNLAWVFHNIEMPCVTVVADMEDTGVAFDFSVQEKLSPKYHKLLEDAKLKFEEEVEPFRERIEKYISKNPNAKISMPINISSPTQLAILLYDILEVEPVDKNSPRGTGAEILEKIKHPICDAILEYRTIEKLVSTYIDKLPECVNPNDGRIHCKYNQYGADTGRFSSSDPNLQNIPSHNKEIRQMFKATDGYVLMSADYSQQEPKVMTQMCGDPSMLQAYLDGKDLYAQIASLAFNKSYEDCLEFYLDENGKKTDKTNKEGKERRSQAKSILLGILYGRGVASIAEQLNTTTEKAQEIQNSVFKGFPAIKQFETDSLNMATDLGYVTTLWGRKRRLPDMQLPEFEFKWIEGHSTSDDPLDFDSEEDTLDYVPEDIMNKYLRQLRRSSFWEQRKIVDKAKQEGIEIVCNSKKIAEATRQCVNSRIQGKPNRYLPLSIEPHYSWVC